MPPKKSVEPEINIGLIGHVDHGKTTLVQSLSGKWADTHSEEIKRGITIRLGYANVSFYKCRKCKGSQAFGIKKKCDNCKNKTELLRKISLVDAPGHESLMATMLCGANIMDGGLLMIAANEECPQPQTVEHLTALEIIGVKNLIIIQNKVDLVSEEQAVKNQEQIRDFLKQTSYKDALIIPMSALHSINMDVLIQKIEELFKTLKRDLKKDPIMYVARSFDVNKPGTKPADLIGGVLGGVLKQGTLKENDEIEILPGYTIEEKKDNVWKPLKTKVTGIITGNNKVKKVTPGGTFGLTTLLDPSIVKADALAGSVVGKTDKLPPVWYELRMELNLLERVVGAKDQLVVEAIRPNEILMLNVNAAATVGVVKAIKKNKIACNLKRPVCANEKSRVAISRRVGNRWRLIGYGKIIKK